MDLKGSKKTVLGLVLSGLAFCVMACGSESVAPDVVASSRLGSVTRGELEEFILSLPEKRRSPREGLEATEWRRSMVEELLDVRAIEAEAKKRSLTDKPEVAEEVGARIEPLLATEVRSRRLEERVKITEEDLRAFYDANPEEFGHGGRIRLRNIFRRIDRNAPPAARETARREMESLLVELRQGSNFADLAKAHSDSETAHLGGLIGKVDRGVFTPELENIIWNLKDGELSDVVPTSVGFQVFKLESHIPPFSMPFEEARGRLRRRLVQEATAATLEEYFQELLAASGAVYQPEALDGENPEAVLFELDDVRLTLSDWRRRQESRSVFAQREPDPGEQIAALARESLFAWEAKRKGIADEPEIAEALSTAKRGVLTGHLAQEYMEQALAESEAGNVSAFYEENKRRYQSPKLVHVHILTRDFPGGEISYQLYEELEQLSKDVRASRRDFAEVARELSDDLSAYRGGDLGSIRLDAFAEWAGPPAQRKVAELAAGEVSEPMLIERYDEQRLRYRRQGYMLIKVEAIHEPAILLFAEARERVIRDYLRLHGEEVGERLREERLAAIGATIHKENL